MGTILEFMSRDHHRLDGLFERYAALKKKDQKAATAAFATFRTGLLKHIAWEEEVLFPLLLAKASLVDRGPVSVMRLEHQEIRDLLESIHRRITGAQRGGSGAYETRLKAVVAEHDRKEELVLYPWIDQLLDAAEREDVLEKLAGAVSLI